MSRVRHLVKDVDGSPVERSASYLEFRNLSIKACLPWIAAYESSHFLSELKRDHFLPTCSFLNVIAALQIYIRMKPLPKIRIHGTCIQ